MLYRIVFSRSVGTHSTKTGTQRPQAAWRSMCERGRADGHHAAFTGIATTPYINAARFPARSSASIASSRRHVPSPGRLSDPLTMHGGARHAAVADDLRAGNESQQAPRAVLPESVRPVEGQGRLGRHEVRLHRARRQSRRQRANRPLVVSDVLERGVGDQHIDRRQRRGIDGVHVGDDQLSREAVARAVLPRGVASHVDGDVPPLKAQPDEGVELSARARADVDDGDRLGAETPRRARRRVEEELDGGHPSGRARVTDRHPRESRGPRTGTRSDARRTGGQGRVPSGVMIEIGVALLPREGEIAVDAFRCRRERHSRHHREDPPNDVTLRPHAGGAAQALRSQMLQPYAG